MVPFIDVVLVLLIIFMITAPILQSGIEVDVPKTKTVKEINEPRLVITIDKNQLVYLADAPVNINQLGSRCGCNSKSRRIPLPLGAPDETIPFGTFAKVIDALRQSGVSTSGSVTEPLSERAYLLNMSTTANTIIPLPPISADDLGLRKFLVYSLILHVFLVLWIAVSIYFHLTGPGWGDVGGTSGSVNVKLVGPASGIPMPPQPIVTDSKTVDPTKGLWKEEPKPKPPEPPTKSVRGSGRSYWVITNTTLFPGTRLQLRIFKLRVCRLWQSVLVRRSQRAKMRWERFTPVLNRRDSSTPRSAPHPMHASTPLILRREPYA